MCAAAAPAAASPPADAHWIELRVRSLTRDAGRCLERSSAHVAPS